MAEARTRQEWARTSSLLALIANVHRDPKKTRPFKPDDFNPLTERSQPTVKVGIDVLKQVFINSRT